MRDPKHQRPGTGVSPGIWTRSISARCWERSAAAALAGTRRDQRGSPGTAGPAVHAPSALPSSSAAPGPSAQPQAALGSHVSSRLPRTARQKEPERERAASPSCSSSGARHALAPPLSLWSMRFLPTPCRGCADKLSLPAALGREAGDLLLQRSLRP